MIVCQRRTAKMTDDIGKTGAYLIGKRIYFMDICSYG